MYLQVPLQSRDILAAHLRIIQSHLRQKKNEGLKLSTGVAVILPHL